MPNRASTYEGVRWPSGTRVTVDGVQLHPPDGFTFDWGTVAPGALLLARAVLADALGTERGWALAGRYHAEVVIYWTRRTWRTTSAEIRQWAATHQAL